MNISLQIVIYQKFYIKNGRYLHKNEWKEKIFCVFLCFSKKYSKKVLTNLLLCDIIFRHLWRNSSVG